MLSVKLTQKLSEIPELLQKFQSHLTKGKGLIVAENTIMDWLNELGVTLVDAGLNQVNEPTHENEIYVVDKLMRYHDKQSRSLKCRFGSEVILHRRVYREHNGERFVNMGEMIAPLDEHLGLHKTGGFTPALSYIVTLCGANDAYNPGSKLISEILQIDISATGVQKTTERYGGEFSASAEEIIGDTNQSQECAALIVTVDATGSPRIADEPSNEPGRASLKNPTVAKMATVIQFEKFNNALEPRADFKTPPPKPEQTFTLATYADENFNEARQLARRGALLVGRNRAKLKIFKGDGLPSNWNLHKDYFSDFIAILDPYHALEHLANACRSIDNISKDQPVKDNFYHWRDMILSGEVIQVIDDLEVAAKKLKGERKESLEKEIGYFKTNRERMLYDTYLEMGIPIGSGNIESACKRVIAHRFKKQGMRWRAKDNRAVLNARLHMLNGTLKEQFQKQVKSRWEIKKAA